MPTTLIFGASRGLGRAFTHCALSQGHRVVALVRNPEMAAELRTLGVEVVEGDALDLEAVAQACRLAGWPRSRSGLDPRQFPPTGTRRLFG